MPLHVNPPGKWFLGWPTFIFGKVGTANSAVKSFLCLVPQVRVRCLHANWGLGTFIAADRPILFRALEEGGRQIPNLGPGPQPAYFFLDLIPSSTIT